MLTVHLHQLVFHSFHGLYDGEERVGNDFEVNLDVTYSVKKDKYDNLKHLINYEDLFYIVQKRMAIPTDLLEELADSIIRKIHHHYGNVAEIALSIHKLNAPIHQFSGKVGIRLVRRFN